jgi:hypothetical protein
MSTTAAMTCRFGPFGPGFFRGVDENNRRYFLVVSVRWKRRSVDGFTTIAARTIRLGRITSAQRPAIRRSRNPQLWRTRPGAIQDQQLLLEK